MEATEWAWIKLETYALNAGEHKLTIGLREDGAKLDKIRISNDPYSPQGMREPTVNLSP